MSGHQSQRPYGTMYNPHLPASPSPAVNYGVPRYPNQPTAYNGYWHGQSPPNGMPFPQNTNGYAQHINAQSSVPPAFPARAAPTAYGGYPGMPPYSAAPTQFIPASLSSAYPIVPHLPQPQVMLNNASYETIANHAPHQQPLPPLPSMGVQDPSTAKEPSVDLEDGELSSGEQEKSSRNSDEKTLTAHERAAPETTHHRNIKPQDVADKDESLNAVNPTPRSQANPTESHDALQDHSGNTLSIREQARRILQELHSFDIGFEDIAREAFDVGLLRELYVEIGLPIPPPEQQTNQEKGGDALKETPSTLNGDHGNPENPSDEVQLNLNVKPATLDTKNISDTSNSNVAHTLPSKPNGLTVSSQETLSRSTAKAPATKPLDRKEYIARLMAAKIGKPTQNSDGAQETPQAPAESNVATSSTQHPPTDSAETTSATNSMTDRVGSPSVVAGDTQRDISNLETKRKAQTDLALQKIEALRAHKKLQEVPQSANSSEKNPRPAPLEVEIAASDPSISTEIQRPAEGPSPTDGRQTSYFSPVSLEPAFSIPGLFTMAQEISTDIRKDTLEPAKASDSIVAPQEEDSANTGIGPRKRLKAADFMDLTPSTVLKSLSKGDDAGVIIDISDDGMENTDDGFDSKSLSKANQKSTSTAPEGVKQDSVFVSPPDSNTPGRFQEPQELKMKESEIELMNRKILELEQRIKAKQAASRVQSPRPPVPLSNSSAIAPETGQLTNPPSQQNESATEEQLVREKEKQENKLATAEAEQSQIAHKGEQLNAKSPFATHESREEIILQRPPPSPSHEKDGHPPDLTNNVNDSINQQKTKLSNEVLKLDTDIARSEEELRNLKLEIDGLNEKVDLAKLDLEHRRSELQQKAERRRLLSQQIDDLPRSVSPTQESQHVLDEAIEIVSERADGENPEVIPPRNISESIAPQDALPPTQSTYLEFQTHNMQPDSTVETEVMESALEPANTDTKNVSRPIRSDDIDRLSNGEVEEDIMDISGSDLNEGEVLEVRRESTSKQEEDMDTSDDDDFYEPPSHINSIQQPSEHIAENRQFAFQPELKPAKKDVIPDSPDHQVDEEMLDETIPAQFHKEDGEKQRLDHEFGEDAKDEDDYEPPEPESSAVRDPEPDTRSPPVHELISNGSAGNAATDEQLTTKTAPERGHFIPYESPLKQFSSYRFHPEFRNKVPGGYRSLTYSNDIRPDVELCQYELSGGVCNDKACTSQHFQKMMLPDHIILSAMGRGEGTTPEEKDDYIKGLRSLILDLRERKIKDLDAIAKAIAEFRLRFLNDTSRVLPL